MSLFIHHPITLIHAVMKRQAGRLLAACAALLYVLLWLGSPQQLNAQCGDPANDLCQDSCCHTDVLLLNTGYDHTKGEVYPLDAADHYWTITEDDNPDRRVPRPADVIDKKEYGWDVLPNSQWIGTNPKQGDDVSGKTSYEKCFCVCSTTVVTINMKILTDGRGAVLVDDEIIAEIPPSTKPTVITREITLTPGRHCITVVIYDDDLSDGPSGFDMRGTIEGPGLLKYNCCAAPSVITDADKAACITNHVVLGSDDTWTIETGAPVYGPYPRCATIITPTPIYWAAPVAGSNWIGTNVNGSSGPYNPGGELYTYRKSFCVARPGTFVISITTAADDSGGIFLNGVYLGYTGPYNGQTTQTFIVALTEGCHCFQFNVVDLGFLITGLDALIDIQGGYMLEESCCSCGSCTQAPQRIGGHEHDLSLPGSAADVTARPMLVSIPNPATGEAAVHYVLDKDAEAHVVLYNTAGERVMVIDEGARTRGEHVVAIATKDLPAGAYRLQLISGDTKLSIPLNVR